MNDVRRGGDDLAGIFYTGGTTGFPKGVMLSHTNLLSSALAFIKPSGYDGHSAFLHVTPMFHLSDLSNLLTISMVGGVHVVLPRFEPKAVLAEVEKCRVTHLPAVPTMLGLLLDCPEWDQFKLDSLRTVIYGGASFTESLLLRALDRLKGRAFVQCYGQTELAPIATILETEFHVVLGEGAGKLKSAGRPTILTEVQIVDPEGKPLPSGAVGEIAVSGPNVMLGYWNEPEESARVLVDGWLRTGDAGYEDDDGFIYVVDRIKDMIISGGENVYSAEVEGALAKHPAVETCAVIGVPDPDWGEAVTAVVVLRDGHDVDEQDLIKFCRNFIAGYKCPRTVRFRQQPLPLSAAGKVLKRELRSEYAGSPR